MKSNYTHVSYLLDRSYSMLSIKKATIDGFNAFIEGQKGVPGEMTLTLAQFDDRYEVPYQMIPIEKVQNLNDNTFVPRGSTALLDSLGRLINDTGKILANLTEDQRPEKVLFLVHTDGEENCSTEFTNEKIKEMIDHQKLNYKWEFMYLGANQDGFAVGATMNMTGASYNATAAGTRGVYTATTDAVAKFRTASVGTSFSLSQNDIDEASK